MPTVLVQTRSSLDETREFLATAAATPFIRGVVGWVDLTDPGVADTIAGLRAGPGGDRLVGIRHQVHDEPDPELAARVTTSAAGSGPSARPGSSTTCSSAPGSCRPPSTLARRRPETRFVIDHIAKPPIRDHVMEPWADRIRPFGALDNVTCKLSGMVTEADWDAWRPSDLAPVRRPRPGGLRAGAPAVRLRLAGLPARGVLRASVRGHARGARTASGTPTCAAVFGGTATEIYRLG